MMNKVDEFNHERTAGAIDALELAAAVADRVVIRDVRLVRSSCELKPYDKTMPLAVEFDSNVTTELDEKNDFVLVFPSFSMTARPAGASKDVVAVNVSATFLLAYHAENREHLSEAHFHRFGEINGVYNAWPYWREFVQNTIVRMGLPPLVIPVYRILSPESQSSTELCASAEATGGQSR